MNRSNKSENLASIWQIVILMLCIYVLVALAVDVFIDLPHEISTLLISIDNIICYIFLIDFTVTLIKAEKKLAYLRWGWIDLVSSIPYVQIFRIGRFVRVIRMFRLLRGVKSMKTLTQTLFTKRAAATLISVCFFSFSMIIFSSIAILIFETAPDSNIITASDAMWWSIVTVTTVGYGDLYPVTLYGRIIAIGLMVVGISLFGTLTAYIASFFVKGKNTPEKKYDEVLDELKGIRNQLNRLEEDKKKG